MYGRRTYEDRKGAETRDGLEEKQKGFVKVLL